MISVTEIILIIVGILAIILGYLIPNGNGFSEEDGELTRDKIDELVRRAVQNSQGQIDDMLDESMEDAINKAERAMDRVTNEKMNAISEYSDTVMNDIHKNHDEVMFMYDMLNDKHKNLKNTVSEVNRTAKEVKQTAEEAVLTAEHAQEAAQSAREEVKKVEARTIRPEMVSASVIRPEPVQTPAYIPEPVQETVRPSESVIRQEPVQEPISYLDDDEDEIPEKQFSSLSEILDRADRAAAEKTQNKVIGSYETESYSEEYEEEIAEPVQSYEEPVQENEYIEDMPVSTGSQDVLPEYEEAPVQNTESRQILPNEGNVAKVVSISDASRKKAADFEAAQIQNAGGMAQADNSNDPISRNQRILEMHKQGKSAVVIARELRLGIGEVKLVIDLAGKHKKNRSSIM
ncbi:MAG: hypothetical protein E7302_11780 [Butyrivibrio sp.]|nr:hypothetical protein [Butyrivibrio sp.]